MASPDSMRQDITMCGLRDGRLCLHSEHEGTSPPTASQGPHFKPIVSCPTTTPEDYRSANLMAASEQKMDLIDVRLKSIEDALQKIAASATPSPQRTPPSDLIETGVIGAESYDQPPRDDDQVLNGDHTLKMQSIHASEFLEHAVTNGQVRELNPSIHAALINLRGLMGRQRRRSSHGHDQRFPLQRPVPEGGLCRLPLPPKAVVDQLLKEITSSSISSCESSSTPLTSTISDSQPTLFTYNCALSGISDFPTLCETAYTSPETCSHAELTVVNACLYYLFVEQFSQDPAAAHRDKFQEYALLCQGNLETCIKSFPLFLSSKIKNIQALSLCVSTALCSIQRIHANNIA